MDSFASSKLIQLKLKQF